MFALVKCLVLLSAAFGASSFNLGDNDVVFHLYTRQNPTESQVLYPTMSSIMNSHYDPDVRSIYTIHSNGDSFGNFNSFVVAAHLEAENANIVAVDWRAGASSYTEGLSNAKQCGEVVAEFVNLLFNIFGISTNTIRLVGAGLGGHVAGIAARNIEGTIPHIIALDPSLHGWSHHPDRLKPNDAVVVEVLHTTAGLYGYDYPLGDIDFYANGGSYQAGCAVDVQCSHVYSYAFYAESITAPGNEGARFVGTACEDYEEAIKMDCSGEAVSVFGGPEVKTSGSGVYIFFTNPSPPFAQD